MTAKQPEDNRMYETRAGTAQGADGPGEDQQWQGHAHDGDTSPGPSAHGPDDGPGRAEGPDAPEFDPSELADASRAEAGEGAETSEEAVARLTEQRDDLQQRLLRVSADYQNYVRRSQQNADQMRTHITADLARSLLTVLDHFDHAIAAGEKSASAEDLLKGVSMVRDELLKVLESFGIARIDVAPGEPFDPNRHEAMMQQEAEGIESQQVVNQIQPGYAIGQVIVRPAKVIVAP